MALISLFSRMVNGIQRQVDLSSNTIVVQAIQINGTLLSSSAGGASGSKLVGDDNSYSNYTPAAATVKGALSGIDSALANKMNTDFSNASGQLSVANGGTGSASFTLNGILYGNSASAIQVTAAGTQYQSLQAGASGVPAFDAVHLDQSAAVSGILPVGNGGTGTGTAFTTGSIVFAGASGVYSQDNANFFWDSTNHKLGIKNAAPTTELHVASTGATGADHGIFQEQNSTNTVGAVISGKKSRGTFGSKTAISSGDALANFGGFGHDGTAYGSTSPDARFSIIAQENFTTSAHGTGIDVYTTRIGTITGLKMARFTAGGGFLLYDTTSQTNTFTQSYPSGGASYSVLWPASQASGTQVLQNDGAGNLSWASGSSGTVTSVALSDGSSSPIYTISGSPVTSSGTLTFTLNNQSANQVFAGPSSGGAAQPSFRSLVSADIPSLSAIYLPLAGGTMSGAINMGGNKVTNAGDPTAAQDLATKNYVDNMAHGLSWKNVVRSATTGALAAYTSSGGILTATSNGALAAQDGVTLVLNDRLLVKNESGGNIQYNGIYFVSQVGDGSHPYKLTRALDANTAGNLTWATVEIGSDASTQAGYIFRESDDIVTLDTDPVAFIIVSHGLDWTFNNGLSVSGNQVNVAPGDTSLTATPASLIVNLNAAGAIVTSSGLMINLESSNPSLQISSNRLGAKLDAAGAITSGASGLKVGVDASSIEISSDALRIKTTAYDQATITGGSGSAAAVAYAPALKEVLVAGEAYAATTLFAVRFAKAADAGFVAGRVYKADNDATTNDNFWSVGLVFSAGSVSTGGNLLVVKNGLINVPSHGFTVGSPIWLGASGAVTGTAPSTSNICDLKLGIVRDANNIEVQIGSPNVF